MKSVRLDAELEERLDEAARIAGKPVSALIREAIEQRCDDILSRRLDHRLADVIGSVASDETTDASQTGAAFGRIVQRKYGERA